MDLFHGKCSGTTICCFVKIVQRTFVSVLSKTGSVDVYSPYSHRPCISLRRAHILTKSRTLANSFDSSQHRFMHTRKHHSSGIFDAFRSPHVSNGSSHHMLLKRRNLFWSSHSSSSMPAVSTSSDNITEGASSRSYESLVQQDMAGLTNRIKQALASENSDVQEIAEYYFDGGGKLLRPSIIILMSHFCHLNSDNLKPKTSINENQFKIALVAEMIHTASLVHDDVIDESDTRRSRPTANLIWGSKKAILAGDYILAKATKVLASIGRPEVISLLAQVIEDLVKGEFMQLHNGTNDSFTPLFACYLNKTFLKTASLFANSCKAVALLSNASDAVEDAAYQYGKNVGLAFQLIDDTLDFVGNASSLGKPAVADLKLGISTAPVLFAMHEYPQLEDLVRRKFSQSGDIAEALELVLKSQGIVKTRDLAAEHSDKAVQALLNYPQSDHRDALIEMAQTLVSRDR